MLVLYSSKINNHFKFLDRLDYNLFQKHRLSYLLDMFLTKYLNARLVILCNKFVHVFCQLFKTFLAWALPS